jgi:protein phosphatase
MAIKYKNHNSELYLEVSAVTDVGKVRDHNEDNFLVHPKSDTNFITPVLIAVADGMGGHNAGEIASKLTVDTLKDLVSLKTIGINKNATEIQETIAKIVKNINLTVFEKSTHPNLQGMGTTLTALLIHKNNLYYAHVGDSRAYILRNNRIVQITEDHSWVAQQVALGILDSDQASTHPNRNWITRAIGLNREVEVDSGYLDVTDYDRILICSDGLYSLVSDAEISGIIFENDSDIAVDELIALANSRGGTDNVTVMLATIYTGINSEVRARDFFRSFKKIFRGKINRT